MFKLFFSSLHCLLRRRVRRDNHHHQVDRDGLKVTLGDEADELI
jgi:hypothetical protein